MTNSEVRQWYLNRVVPILELNEQWIQQGFAAQARAEAAWRMRHESKPVR